MVPLTVVIPTRNRGAQAAEAAAAVLRDPGDFELVVVDQSTDERTVEALAALPPDPRMRVHRSPLKGLSTARNTGVAQARAPIIAFTDDDCRPDPGWASTMLRVFQQDPEAALVFGRVRLPDFKDGTGYAASFEPSQRIMHGGIPDPTIALGVGANFGIRREVHSALGGFDPLLGPGTPHFRSGGEETDLLIRALHGGYRIVNAAECDVLHLGVREGAEIRKLAVGYQLGTGAAFGKLARLSGVSGLKPLVARAGFYAGNVVRELISLKRPHPGHLCYFLAGAALSFRYGLDRQRRVFTERGRPAVSGQPAG